MPDTPVNVYHDLGGISSPLLKLYPLNGGPIANGAGDALAVSADGLFAWRATVGEALAGIFRYEVVTGSVGVGHGFIYLTDTTDLHHGQSTIDQIIRQVDLSTLLTRSQRIDNMVENSSGDRWKAKALETAPTGGGGGTLSAADIRDAIGMATNNMDAQLLAILNKILTAQGVRDALGLGANNLDTQLTAILNKIATIAEIEAALVNGADGTDLLQLIADKLAGDMTKTDLTVQAIAAATRDALLDRVVAGNHDTEGSVGGILQQLEAGIAQLTAVVTTGQIITVSHQLPNEWIVLVRGDSYKTTNNRPLSWKNETGANWPSELTGTVRFTAVHQSMEGTATADVPADKKIEIVGDIINGTAPDMEVQAELEAGDTDRVEGLYNYDVEITLANGIIQTLVTTADQTSDSATASITARKPKKYLKILPHYSQ